MATMTQAVQAKEEAKRLLRGLSGVSGIGIAWDKSGQPCVRVNLDRTVPEATRDRIPSCIHDVPVQIREVDSLSLE